MGRLVRIDPQAWAWAGAIFGVAALVVIVAGSLHLVSFAPAAEGVGLLYSVGCGTIVGLLALTLQLRAAAFWRLVALGVVALCMAAVFAWLSLFGGQIRHVPEQATRYLVMLTADAGVALFLIGARVWSVAGRPPGLSSIAAFSAIRVALEALVLEPLPHAIPAAGAGGTGVSVLTISVLVLIGWIVFPVWQLILFRWDLHGRPDSSLRQGAGHRATAR